MNLTELDGTAEGSLLPGPPLAAQHSRAPCLGRALEEGHLPTSSDGLIPHHLQPRTDTELLGPTIERGNSKETRREVRKPAFGLRVWE